MKDTYCPSCYSRDITQKYIYASGDAYECMHCGKMWGWYYDRNKPENKYTPDPFN
jgi:uncharacterized Zn finger protein